MDAVAESKREWKLKKTFSFLFNIGVEDMVLELLFEETVVL